MNQQQFEPQWQQPPDNIVHRPYPSGQGPGYPQTYAPPPPESPRGNSAMGTIGFVIVLVTTIALSVVVRFIPGNFAAWADTNKVVQYGGTVILLLSAASVITLAGIFGWILSLIGAIRGPRLWGILGVLLGIFAPGIAFIVFIAEGGRIFGS